MPVLARGAAMRFLMTRAYDWMNTPEGALVTRKDPMAFARRLEFYADPANAGIFAGMKTVEVFTDGACKGNPGPGGWGALLRMANMKRSCPAPIRKPQITAWK